MKYYEEIKDPTRVREGDVVVIPASKAKGLALTPNALSRYGVSHGFTSRSDNDSDSLTKMFTKPLSEGRAIAFAVSDVWVPYDSGGPGVRAMRSFFDMDNGDPSSTAPSVRRVTRAELAPIHVGTVLNGEPISSAEDTAAAAVIASPDVTRLAAKAADRLSRIGAALRMSDLALTAPGPVFPADDIAVMIRNMLNCEGRAECSDDSSHHMPRGTIPRDSGPDTVHELAGYDLRRKTGQAISIIHGYKGDSDPRIRLLRSDTVTLTADALSLLARRGAVFLRPTERMRDTVLDRLLQWISVRRRKQSESTSFSVSDVTAAARKALARVRERTASWDARVRKTAKSADRNMSGISKETKGIV